MNLLKKIEQRLLLGEQYAIFALIFFIVASVFYKMTARNFFTSEFAIDISDKISALVPHCVLLLGLLGASIGISRSEVISIELFTRLLNENRRKVVLKTVYFFSALVCLVFLWLAAESLEFGDKLWIGLGYMPVLGLLFLKSLFRVFEA